MYCISPFPFHVQTLGTIIFKVKIQHHCMPLLGQDHFDLGKSEYHGRKIDGISLWTLDYF